MSDFSAGLDRAEDAIKEMVPVVVRRHRGVGILTWRLLHQIESEVLAEVAATGEHSRQLLSMLRSLGLMDYPKDDREVSLTGHEVVPVVFSEVVQAWSRVD
jgi:hypothetical protein